MVLETLIEFGLTKKEAQVYIALLELYRDTVQNIAKKAKVARPTAYLILESLQKKGLCSIEESKKTKYYVAENPSNLDFFLSLQKKEIELKQERLNTIKNDLQAIYNSQVKEEPFVRFIEGKQAFLTTREEMVMSSEEKVMRAVYPLDTLWELYSDIERQQSHQSRVKNGVHGRVLYGSKERIVADDPTRDCLRFDIKNFPMSADIGVYGDNVRITSLKGQLNGIVINNKDIAETMKSLFELAWLGAKSLKESSAPKVDPITPQNLA